MYTHAKSSVFTEQNNRCGNSTAKSQAPDDGYINVRKHVEHIRSEIKIASDIKLVFYSSTITMMHGPINIRLYRPNKNFVTYNWLHAAQTFLRKEPPSYSKTHYPLCNLKVHWRIHNSEALGPIHKQMNSLHVLAYRYLSIHFIIILSRVFTFLTSHACYMLRSR